MLIKRTKAYLEKKRIAAKKKKQRRQVESEWQGYEADKLMKMIHQAQQNHLDENGWKELMERILFILSPYYDILEEEQRSKNQKQQTVVVPMLSVRQMNTFCFALSEIQKGDVLASIRRFTDFIHDYGQHKDNLLSGFEVYIICIWARQIVDLINQETEKVF